MKKLIYVLLACITFYSEKGFSQNWKVTGNNANASDYLGTNNNFPLKFYTNGHQQMVILQNGNVGIGTSTPNYPLSVQGNALINGTLFANNLAASNGISVGSFKIVNGSVDSINSATGTIFMSAATINIANGLNAQNITVSQNLKTLGTVNMPGIATNDSAPDLMQIDKTGRVSALSSSSVRSVLFSNANQYQDPCLVNDIPAWNYSTLVGAPGNQFIYTNSQCTWVGIDVPGVTGYPTQPLDVGGNALFRTVVTVQGPLEEQSSINITTPNISGLFPLTTYDNNGKKRMILSNDQGGSIELGGGDHQANPITNGVPYIDFHYGNGLVQDYNTRIINSKDGELDVVGGASVVTASFITTGGQNYVRANEIRVCNNNSCDFVFDKKYDLMKLDSLESYLKMNHHLPGIASAKEMEAEGTISVGKMEMQLLQKVEELTLYILQQDKKIDSLEKQVSELNKK